MNHPCRLIRGFSASLIVALVLFASSLHAQVVSYTVSGHTTTNFIEAGALSAEYPVGSAWTAILAWDTSASTLYLDAAQSQYRLTDFTVTLQGLHGSWTTSANPNTGTFKCLSIS